MNNTNISSLNLTMANEDQIPGLSREASIVGASLGTVVVVLGIFGNVLVILAVLLNKPLRKSSNVFVVSLAVCDLFQTVVVRPLYINTYIRGRWEFGPHVCVYSLYASNLAILDSISHVLAIALYRYVIIVHPGISRKLQSAKAVVLLIILVYMVPLLLAVLPSLLRAYHIMDANVRFNIHIMFCTYQKPVDMDDAFSGSVLRKIMKLLVILTTAMILFFCYIRIFQTARQSGRSVNKVQGSINPTRLQREMNLLKTVIVIFVSFVLCYLPVTVMYAMGDTLSPPDAVYVTSVILLWCSSSVNWMIYGFMNEQFLEAYRHVLCGRAYSTRNTVNNGFRKASVLPNDVTRNLDPCRILIARNIERDIGT